jgi:hypothetical protein
MMSKATAVSIPRHELLNCRQFQGQSNTEYLESLRSWADTIEYHRGILTFAQKAASQPGANGITHNGITCFNCQGTGHMMELHVSSLMQHNLHAFANNSQRD